VKYIVWRKRFVSLIGNLIVVDILLISVIVFFWFHGGGFETIAPLSAILFVINVLYFVMLRFEGSVIVFEENEVRCVFLNYVRRMIPYTDIRDYGLFHCGTMFQGRERFIYISRFEMPGSQRDAEAYKLYKKTKNVLVLQYNEDAFNILKHKCPDVLPTITLTTH